MLTTGNRLFDETWKKLLNYMDTMFQFQSISRDAYLDFYRTVHHYFTCPEYQENLLKASQPKPKTTNESDKNSNQSESVPDDTDLPGGEMYFSLKNYIQEYLKKKAENGNNLQGEDFLRFYAKTWEKFQFLITTINNLFKTLYNSWIYRQHQNKIEYVHEVSTMSMQMWQDLFLKESTQSLAQTCLNLIKSERDGQRIDSLLIRQVIQSYIYAGFTEAERKNDSSQSPSLTLATYRDYFEKQFLQDTEQFYRIESENYLENNSVNDYLKKATKRLEEEERRVKDCLHETTLPVLKRIVENVLIKDHLESIYVESKTLLRNEKIEDLRILFKLVNRINDNDKPIQKDLEEYTYEIGMNAINSISATANKDPKVYVEAILEVYKRFSEIVKEAFFWEPSYVAALDKAFGKFINKNAVTQAAGGKSTKSPELLARYCDTLLRKGNKGAEDRDVEEKIVQIMIVFNYVEDKDVFQKFYGKLLAKRLVGQLSASDDYEASMISKLKEACGFEYASKLERMFQDISISTSLVGAYKTYCDDHQIPDIIDFHVMVLTSNSWPFSTPAKFAVPKELRKTSDSFTDFYRNKFTGRKLEWLYQYSKGDLLARCNKSKYTFQVSTYQMAILLLFNDSPNLTVEKIQDETQIETGLLFSNLISLLKSKVLTCLEINADKIEGDLKDSDIKINYTIQFHENFKSKKVKINLNVPIKSVEQKDSDSINQSVEEERKILIQAAIVRIAKARKSLRHTELIQEVIPQLASRFQPQIPTIKKCIDLLIEKDYLTRDPNERDLYNYVA